MEICRCWFCHFRSCRLELETIKATGAEKVHVTHGQIAVFTKYLNEIGINAFEVNTKFGDEEEDAKETTKIEEK